MRSQSVFSYSKFSLFTWALLAGSLTQCQRQTAAEEDSHPARTEADRAESFGVVNSQNTLTRTNAGADGTPASSQSPTATRSPANSPASGTGTMATPASSPTAAATVTGAATQTRTPTLTCEFSQSEKDSIAKLVSNMDLPGSLTEGSKPIDSRVGFKAREKATTALFNMCTTSGKSSCFVDMLVATINKPGLSAEQKSRIERVIKNCRTAAKLCAPGTLNVKVYPICNFNVAVVLEKISDTRAEPISCYLDDKRDSDPDNDVCVAHGRVIGHRDPNAGLELIDKSNSTTLVASSLSYYCPTEPLPRVIENDKNNPSAYLVAVECQGAMPATGNFGSFSSIVSVELPADQCSTRIFESTGCRDRFQTREKLLETAVADAKKGVLKVAVEEIPKPREQCMAESLLRNCE